MKYEIYRKQGDGKTSKIIKAHNLSQALQKAHEVYPDGDGWNIFVSAKKVYDWHKVTEFS